MTVVLPQAIHIGAIQLMGIMAGKLKGTIPAEGKLTRREDGGLSIGGRALQPGQEVEVCLYDPMFQAVIWTRASVSMEKRQRLIGLDRDVRQEGLKARIREL